MSSDDKTLRRIGALCRGVDPGVVEAILARFGREFFQQFPPQTIARHAMALAKLAAQTPAAVAVERRADGSIDCTVAAFDHPFEFCAITGLLSAAGVDVQECDALTLRAPQSSQTDRRAAMQRRRLGIRRRDPTRDAVILDHFHGRRLEPGGDFKTWARSLEQSILEVMRLFDEDDPQSSERAKRLVNERVTQWLRGRRQADPRLSGLAPIDVAIEPLPRATRLRLRAADMPAFLYALGAALSLHGLEIYRTRARTIDGQATDEIDVVERHGKPLAGQDRIEQLRLSVLLTQQFAYFLDRAPDPLSALRRFEELSEKIMRLPERSQWLALLAGPLSMVDLAKVLGASDFLWEDVIRVHVDMLLPVLQRHARGREVLWAARSLPRRLDEALAGAANFDEERRRLNQFKDRELFLIEIDDILAAEHPDTAFQIFSERLVQLAETLVSAAAQLVHKELLRLYGQPRDSQGHDASWAIFGLGKLGGVALGYASDIEMLFMFDSSGTTAGGSRGALDNEEFYTIFTRETCAYIQAKREGIFEVDLRLRPFGKNGPLACSLERFSSYYGPGGPAHAFERMALARLRWIAGQPRLGYQVEAARDALLYAPGARLDLEAVWEITEKMRAERSGGRQLNSKYSPGALVDLETMVQMLQVSHAAQAPQLQTPRLNDAIASLHRAAVLDAVEFDQLMGSYQFLRRLINAQRMLRGSARDLFLPAANSDELLHLARRMNYSPSDAQADLRIILLEDFARHTKSVRGLIRRHLAGWRLSAATGGD
jgi:glutamate-ammonia-ligase adenylyltransferase